MTANLFVSEWPSRSRSLWRRVRPVLLIALLVFVCAAAIAAPAKHAVVTLDVKDADVHDVLKSIQKQCGIRNLIIDPGVTGGGTFLFRNVPCRTALDTVLRVNGLAATSDYGNLVAVRPR